MTEYYGLDDLSQLKTHPAAAMFPMLSRQELIEMGADIKAHGLRSPLVLWRPTDGEVEIIDGRNRLAAMRIAGLDETTIACDVVRETSGVDPYEYVISANIVRRHLTGAQKRELIEKLLLARPERSDRQIAATVKVDPKTVAVKRRQMQGDGQIPVITERVEAGGRKARGRSANVEIPHKAEPVAHEAANVEIPHKPPEPAPGTITISVLPEHFADSARCIRAVLGWEATVQFIEALEVAADLLPARPPVAESSAAEPDEAPGPEDEPEEAADPEAPETPPVPSTPVAPEPDKVETEVTSAAEAPTETGLDGGWHEPTLAELIEYERAGRRYPPRPRAARNSLSEEENDERKRQASRISSRKAEARAIVAAERTQHVS